jgi:hypothetical protein
LRRQLQRFGNAAIAHGRYEKDELGHHDDEWPGWYAAHMARAAGVDA